MEGVIVIIRIAMKHFVVIAVKIMIVNKVR